MISVSSSSVGRCVVLFLFLFFFLPAHSFIMTDVSPSDAPNANTLTPAYTSRTRTRTGTRKPFIG